MVNHDGGTVPLTLQIIVGSTRAGRHADAVRRWIEPIAAAHGAFAVEVLDLRDWPLPFFQETIATVDDFADPTYSEPIVKRWNATIGRADAYLIVTPEYNHGVPAVLKNAIDSVFFSFRFRRKPVAFAAYSLSFTAGARAVTQLTEIMVEAEAVPVRTPTLIPLVTSAFDADGAPVNPALRATLDAMLDDLAWLGRALAVARREPQLPPAALRVRAALGRTSTL